MLRFLFTLALSFLSYTGLFADTVTFRGISHDPKMRLLTIILDSKHRVMHLNFIQALHKDTTVAPTLAFTFDDQRAAPFDVELVAFEMLARFNIALTGLDCHDTLFYGPSGRLV